MFAVIRAGGRQYRVAAGDLIEVDRMSGDAGDPVSFAVLAIGGPDGPTLGNPLVAGASVAGEVVEQGRSGKVIAFKKRRRKNSRRARGHRQDFTLVRITDILPEGGKPAARPAKQAVKPKRAADAAPESEPRTARPPAEAAAPATLFTAPDGAPDDLKKITGVGPVLEKRLNAIGITRYEQIAALSPEDAARADEALGFKGRIERDGWIEQARALAEGGGAQKE